MVPSNQLLPATAWKRSFACAPGKGVDLKRRAESGERRGEANGKWLDYLEVWTILSVLNADH